MSFDHDTDPYGALEWAIGSGDDFWCFDYARDRERGLVRIHAVINSETGHFIMDAAEPVEVPEAEAVTIAQGFTDDAITWLFDSGDIVEHDTEGWNQDPTYFWRCLKADLEGKDPPKRIASALEA
jgi:hypothetical protein